MSHFENNETYIYKYYPITTKLVKLFTHRAIWFGSLKSFNDPFEAEFQMNLKNTAHKDFAFKFYKDYLKLNDEDLEIKLSWFDQDKSEFYEDLRKSYRNFLSKGYGISCFSSSCSNVLLWSHYADAHEGICIVFNKKKLIDYYRKKDVWVVQKEKLYKKEPFIVNAHFNGKKLLFDNVTDIMGTKSNLWAYEDEIRFIKKLHSKNSFRYIDFHPDYLEAVIFGNRTKLDDKRMLYALIRSSAFRKITFLQAQKDLTTNSIRPIELFTEGDFGPNLHFYAK